jgi:hypothetical protein
MANLLPGWIISYRFAEAIFVFRACIHGNWYLGKRPMVYISVLSLKFPTQNLATESMTWPADL